MIKWNSDQSAIINARKGNVIVSASAGSGKTTVMIERVKQLILDKVPIKRIVMLSFNESIAKEIRIKLVKELENMSINNEWIAEQLDNIDIAPIGTIDSFCNSLIREFFQELQIDPSSAVMEESIAKSRLTATVNRIIKKYKTLGSKDIYDIVNKLGGESALADVIKDIYYFASVQPDREEWLNNATNIYGRDLNNSDSVTAFLKLVSKRYRVLIRSAEDVVSRLVGDKSKRGEHLKIWINSFACFDSAVDYKSLYDSVNRAKIIINEIARKVGSNVKCIDSDCVAEYARLFDSFRNLLTYIGNIVKYEYSFANDKHLNSKFHAELLAKYALETARDYRQYKVANSLIDFSDMSYYAVQLLRNSEFAEEIASRYDYVFIDEYQDTNYVGEFVLSAISRNNLFMVGDSKQSIYRFRLAEPKIMLDKFRCMSDADRRSDDVANKRSAINLNTNYRSDRRVLKFVNDIFDSVMTDEYGGVNYRATDRLSADISTAEMRKTYEGYESLDFAPYVTVRWIVDSAADMQDRSDSDSTFDDDISCAEDIDTKEDLYNPFVVDVNEDKTLLADREGAYIAECIKKFLDSNIYDAKLGKTRKVRGSDICLLALERNKNVEQILSVVEKSGVRIDTRGLSKNKECVEVEQIICMLKLIDNDRQDIILAAGLRSHWGGLTSKDLCEIRRRYRGKFFYECARESVAELKKTRDFYTTIGDLRRELMYRSVYEIVFSLVYNYGFDKAIAFDSCSMQKVEQFLLSIKSFSGSLNEFLSNLNLDREYTLIGDDLSDYYVKTSTIHKSKGLEFPIVFLIDSAKKFNSKTKQVILNKDYGIGVNNFDDKELLKHQNFLTNVLKEIEKEELLNEKMRLLYVALTRAKNHIIITGTVEGKDVACDKYTMPYAVGSFKDWISNAIAVKTLSEQYCDIVTMEFDKLDESANVFTKLDCIAATEEIKKYFNYDYPHQEATKIGLKHTVTEIIHKDIYEDKRSITPTNDDSGVNKTLRGTNYHAILEHIDYHANSTTKIERELARMLEDGLIDQGNLDSVVVSELVEIMNSEVIKLASRHTHYREKEFMLKVRACDVMNTEVVDEVLVQGAIDLIIDTGEKLIVVDFKKSKRDTQSLIETYKEQLNIYAYAVQEAMQRKVDRKVICVIGRNEIIEIE